MYLTNLAFEKVGKNVKIFFNETSFSHKLAFILILDLAVPCQKCFHALTELILIHFIIFAVK